RQEVQNLRELMEQMRPVNLTPPQLLDFLADAAEKFQRATGIATTFVCEREEVSLSPRVCRELARIVQEALVNIRKHSGAQNAVVRFAAHDGRWRLVVDDDGRGFPFSGRFDLARLDAERKGPVVIKERVRTMGGEITVESTPGRGSRLEITLP
ncbi:MAG: sensor histidine kinase, partial [Candidatus Acidiferrales bacterium]